MERTKENLKVFVEDILAGYPEKAKKTREKHIAVVEKDDTSCSIKSNRKSVPGVMTIRGCAYAGSKGVVWGPIKDMVHISHGPVGCGQYSWGTRRNYYNGITGINSFGVMHITSDFQEKDIVFGGDKKLEKLIDEIQEMFPLNRGITIQSECPIGLIGDDIEAVARKKSEEISKPIVPVRCEGFRGVSQSLGHHIANDALRDWIYEKGVEGVAVADSPYNVALMGDYNIGGDAWSSRKILEDMGLNVISQSTGDCTLSELANIKNSKLVLLHCYRSMNYIARYLEEKFGVPWIEFNFFGPTQIFKSMRKIAEHFDEKIQEKTEYLINEVYKPKLDSIVAKYRRRLEGKKVVLYVGGLRPRHIMPAFQDLGMDVVLTGYEFAHNDDYQRTLEYLEGTTVLVDDMTEYELEKIIEKVKPDLFGSGIKEKYQIQKAGVPFRQMHSWDYSGPYHGIDGFEIFAKDVDMAVNGYIWKKISPPWS